MNDSRAVVHLWRVIAFSSAHFVVAMLIAIAAFGSDMDPLRSRSASSRAAADPREFVIGISGRTLSARKPINPPPGGSAKNAWPSTISPPP